jgi:hypothetical protein
MTPETRRLHLKEQAERYYNKRYKRRFPKEEGMFKICRKCHASKPKTTEFFAVNKVLKGGFNSWCRECIRDVAKGQRIRKEYGISRAEYTAMFADAYCAICQTGHRLVLDHCHNMGTPRGVLCSNCNTGIGMFKDDPHLMEAAAVYIRGSRS